MSDPIAQRRSGWRLPVLLTTVIAVVAAALLSFAAWRELRTGGAAVSKVKIERNAGAASAKARTARDPDAASRIVEALIADVRAANSTFSKDLAGRGYLDAIGASALQSPTALSAAPERIRGSRGLFETARQKQLARTDVAITAVKALPAQNEVEEILLEDMLDELDKNRSARRAYWDAMLNSADAMEGMARVLIRSQGAWTADTGSRSIVFANEADAAAYDAEAARRANYEAEADRRLGQLNRSADTLTTLAKRWGKEG